MRKSTAKFAELALLLSVTTKFCDNGPAEFPDPVVLTSVPWLPNTFPLIVTSLAGPLVKKIPLLSSVPPVSVLPVIRLALIVVGAGPSARKLMPVLVPVMMLSVQLKPLCPESAKASIPSLLPEPSLLPIRLNPDNVPVLAPSYVTSAPAGESMIVS